MPSKLTLHMLLAASLAVLQLSVTGAPLEEARTNCTSDVEGSGKAQREETTSPPGSLNVFEIWKKAIALTQRHKAEFKKEFPDIVNYDDLAEYTHPSFPDDCPNSNFSKEACLQRLAEGLLTYMVLLKHVEKEYPNNSIVKGVREKVPSLIPLITAKMRRSERVKAMTGIEQQQLLNELDSPDTYIRKMRAHSILSYLHYFLIDGMRSFRQCEKLGKQAACTDTTN